MMVCSRELWLDAPMFLDRKSTRLNSSHLAISHAVFCLQKKFLDGSAQSALQHHRPLRLSDLSSQRERSDSQTTNMRSPYQRSDRLSVRALSHRLACASR